MLPTSVEEPLQKHLAKVKSLHQQDLQHGYGEVYLPDALERKYPNANREWAQYLFPAAKLSIDPRSNAVRRHHIPESVIQNSLKSALQNRNRKTR